MEERTEQYLGLGGSSVGGGVKAGAAAARRRRQGWSCCCSEEASRLEELLLGGGVTRAGRRRDARRTEPRRPRSWKLASSPARWSTRVQRREPRRERSCRSASSRELAVPGPKLVEEPAKAPTLPACCSRPVPSSRLPPGSLPASRLLLPRIDLGRGHHLNARLFPFQASIPVSLPSRLARLQRLFPFLTV